MSFEFRFKAVKCLVIFFCLTGVEPTSILNELKIDNIYYYPKYQNVENAAVFVSDCFYILDRPNLLERYNNTKEEEENNPGNREIINNFKADLSDALKSAIDKINFYDRVPRKLKHKLTKEEKKLINNIVYKLEMMDSQEYFGEVFVNPKMYREVQEFVKSLNYEGRGISQFTFFLAYTSLIDAVLKTLALDFFYYYDKNAFNKNITNEEFNEKTSAILNRVIKSLGNHHETLRTMVIWADKRFENNDPIEFQRDINFIELERVFQPFLANSLSLGQHRQCRSIKNFLWQTRKLNDQVLCEGYASDCTPVQSFAYCKGEENSSRRFEWMGFNSDQFPSYDYYAAFDMKKSVQNSCGNMNACRRPFDFTIKNQRSDWYYDENCLCICTENTHFSNKSTFIISSQFVESDIHENKVVVGVRFVKEERIIYIQIEQAEILPGGWIRNETIGWKEIRPLSRKRINKALFDQTMRGKDKYSSDYIVIDKDTKTFDLDDLECDRRSHVVTGVGLKLRKIQNENRIFLSIKCQNTSFIDGQLIIGGDYYVENIETDSVKKDIGEMPPNKISYFHVSNYNASDEMRYYVELEMSSAKRDAGQSVIPWFDAQSVSLNDEPSPLNGIGLYHRGTKNSGGLLAFRLFTLDHSILI